MPTIFEKFQKLNLLSFVAFIVSIFLLALLIWLVIQQFGLFQKQVLLPPEAEQIQQQVEIMKNSSVVEESKNLEKIVPPAEKIEILELNPEEIGKNNPFE